MYEWQGTVDRLLASTKGISGKRNRLPKVLRGSIQLVLSTAPLAVARVRLTSVCKVLAFRYDNAYADHVWHKENLRFVLSKTRNNSYLARTPAGLF